MGFLLDTPAYGREMGARFSVFPPVCPSVEEEVGGSWKCHLVTVRKREQHFYICIDI